MLELKLYHLLNKLFDHRLLKTSGGIKTNLLILHLRIFGSFDGLNYF